MGVRGARPASAAHRAARCAANASGVKTFRGDPCRQGHDAARFTANGRCTECQRLSKRRADPDARRRADGIYRSRTRVRRRALERARYVPRPRALLTAEEKATRRKAYEARPDVKARRAERVRTAQHADPTKRLNKRMSKAVWRALRVRDLTKAGRSWTDLVSYTVQELRDHLERQFLGGMSWANAGDWQVDHIVPIASFGPMEPGDDAFRACWALTNLRPLWKPLNIAKAAKREHLL